MVVLTDTGLETWLLFHRGLDLPFFAAYPLLEDDAGRSALHDYYADHLRVAADAGLGLVLETPTWRASADWGERLGHDAVRLDACNRRAVAFVREVADEVAPEVDLVVSGNLGPRGDGYRPDHLLDLDEAATYHHDQVASLAAAGADRITLLTATHVAEAAGVVLAALDVGVPVVVSFTVEQDGRLPDGTTLGAALTEVDERTDGAALHLGVNCAHPDHFAGALATAGPVARRVGLLRANASRASHQELDAATELDDGDPDELAAAYATLVATHPDLAVLGGCCGTDVRHVAAIAAACGRG